MFFDLDSVLSCDHLILNGLYDSLFMILVFHIYGWITSGGSAVPILRYPLDRIRCLGRHGCLRYAIFGDVLGKLKYSSGSICTNLFMRIYVRATIYEKLQLSKSIVRNSTFSSVPFVGY